MSILLHCTSPTDSLRHLHSISLTPHVLVDGRVKEWSGSVHRWLAAICPSITVGGMDDEGWRRGMERETSVRMMNDFVKILNANVEVGFLGFGRLSIISAARVVNVRI